MLHAVPYHKPLKRWDNITTERSNKSNDSDNTALPHHALLFPKCIYSLHLTAWWDRCSKCYWPHITRLTGYNPKESDESPRPITSHPLGCLFSAFPQLSSMVDFIFSLSHLKQWKIYHNTLYNDGSGMGLGDFFKAKLPFYGWRDWGPRGLSDMPEVPPLPWACSPAIRNALCYPPSTIHYPNHLIFNSITVSWKVHSFYSRLNIGPEPTQRSVCSYHYYPEWLSFTPLLSEE